MRKKGLCILLAASAWFVASTAEADWRTNFSTAQNEARMAGKPLLIHFYADWCPPCRQMEASVLNTASVKNLLATQVIGVKLNSDFNKDLVQRFGVTSLPADVVLEPDGRVSASYTGASTLGTFEQRLRGLIRTTKVSTPKPKPSSTSAKAKPSNHIAMKPVISKAAVPRSTVSKTASMTLSAVGPIMPKPTVQPPVTTQTTSITMVLKAQPAESTTSCLLTAGGGSVGLGGYSPVALQNRNWVRGSEKHSAVHGGVTYLFATSEEANTFRQNPDRFVPGLNGLDPVALAESDDQIVGTLEFAATYGSKNYFFSSRANRDKFVADAGRYGATAN